jgi:transcriptional regulator of acetoin/glycerol metabolism
VALARSLSAAHERFVETGRTSASVRPLVAKSWRRCLDTGVDPETSRAPVELLGDELDQWRRAHPLAPVLPVIRRLLVADAVEAGLLVAVSDAEGRLLWVDGPPRVRTRAESIHFVEGACWSEDRAGTNAPGTALTLDQPVQIFAAEHLARPVMPWSCTASPIHDPDSGAVLGVLDLTGGDEVAAPRTLSLVRATVAAVEAELRVRRLQGADPVPPADDRVVLRVLGRPTGTLGDSRAATRLALRHSELLVLLSSYPDGVSGDRLATLLHEHDLAAVTLRAELSRLRSIVAPLTLHSRPYRLSAPMATDVGEVRALLARGQVHAAVARYAGPLLPASEAPGVVELRESLHARMRAAVLAERDPELLLAFADTDHSRSDWELWAEAARTFPGGPVLEQVRAHVRRLDRELGNSTATLPQRRCS